MPQKRLECFRLLFDHLAWIKHEFLSGIRDSRKAGSLWGMMRGVGVVKKSIQHSWLAKGLGLGLLCWGFKEFRKRFCQKRRALFESGQWHFHQDNASVHNSINWGDERDCDTLTQEDFHGAFQKLFEWYNKCIVAGGDYFEGDKSFMCVLSIKVPIQKKSGNLFHDPHICIHHITNDHLHERHKK